MNILTEPMDTETRMKRLLAEYDAGLWKIDPQAIKTSYTGVSLSRKTRPQDFVKFKVDKKDILTRTLLEWLVWAMSDYRSSLGLGRNFSYPACLHFQGWYDTADAHGYIIQSDGLIGKYRYLADELEQVKKDRDTFKDLLEKCQAERGDTEYSEVKSEDLSDEDREKHT